MAAAYAAPTCTAAEALTRLKRGNARFVAGGVHFPTLQQEVLADLATGLHPYATILGCSDSRVPPELLFGAGLGELFIVRVAGQRPWAIDDRVAAIRRQAPAWCWVTKVR